MWNTKTTKRFIGTLVLLFMALAGLSSEVFAAPVVIDFEDLPAGPFPQGPEVFVNNQYADRGITFNNAQAFDFSLGPSAIPGFAHSGTKAIQQCSGLEGCTTPIEMRFTAGQTRVKVWVGFNQPLPLTGITVVLRAFNPAGQEVSRATTTLFGAPQISPVRTPLEVNGNANITRAVVQRLLPNGNVDVTNNLSVDDVEFETAGPARPLETTFGPPNSANPSGTFAEPVNTATGNYLFQRTDLMLPGRGMPFIFTRTYNSLDTYAGPFGHGSTHSYNIFLTENAAGIVVIKQGDGHEEFYDPIGGGNYQSRFGVFNILVKNPDGTFTLILKDQTHYQFSTSGKLIRIRDRNGNALHFRYDAKGNLTAITDTVGRTITLSYDTRNRIIQLIDPIRRGVQYSYDADGSLASDTDPNGGVMRYFYDGGHRVTQIIDQRGNTLLKNSYDTADRVVSQTNGRGFTTKFAYGVPQAGDTSITDPQGNTTIHTHDTQLRLIEVTDPDHKKLTFTYDEDNNRISITDQNRNVTRFTYDNRGNFTSITDPLLNVIDLTYDGRNNLISLTGARRFTTALTYDAKGNLISIQDALKNITTFAYDNFGQVVKNTNARNQVTHAYDEHGNLETTTDAMGGTTTRASDGAGRLISLTNPNGHTVTSSYDANSRLIKLVDAGKFVTEYAYDPAGNLIEVTDARRHSTRYDYDQVNNLTTVTDALGHNTRYAYDENNNRTDLIDANGHKRTYAFDALNRPIRITDPLGNMTNYTYDPAGNIIAVTDANGTTNTFAYDANNLLEEVAYGDGSSVTYRYDANGNRVRMGDLRGTSSYAYDALDQVIKITHPDGSIVRYGYDEVGNRTSLTYPDDRMAVYNFDALNRLIDARNLGGQGTQYFYDAASNLRRIIYPNATTISYGYDKAERLVTVTNKRSEDTLAQFHYNLDELGNRTRIRASGLTVPERTVSYTYDALSQLIAEEERHSRGPSKRTEYVYDPVGNRVTQSRLLTIDDGKAGRPKVINYTYDDADRLLQAGDKTFTYDDNGNRLAATTAGGRSTKYTYDAANRLIRIVLNERAATYAYDGDGNKVEQSLSAGPYSTETLQFLNDVATPWPVVLKQDRGKEDRLNETIHYLYGLALISEELAPLGRHPQNFFYHSDGLGSTIALTDRAGGTRTEYQYDAWGNLERSFGDIPNRFLFTSEEQDSETGLYYLRARWYDPETGVFLSRDPLPGVDASPRTLHPYMYAFNNPTTFRDPTGLWPKWVKKAASAVRRTVNTVVTPTTLVGAALVNPLIAQGAGAVWVAFNPTTPTGRFVISNGVGVGAAVGTFVLFKNPTLAGAVGGFATSFTDRLLSGRPRDLCDIFWRDVVIGGGVGALSGLGGAVVAPSVGDLLNNVLPEEFLNFLLVKSDYALLGFGAEYIYNKSSCDKVSQSSQSLRK
jgi:RHS repeat-associated protein